MLGSWGRALVRFLLEGLEVSEDRRLRAGRRSGKAPLRTVLPVLPEADDAVLRKSKYLLP